MTKRKFTPYPKSESTKGKSKLKYGNKKCMYNGYNYDSIKEANYAENLDWRIKIGEVLKWERQVKISIDINSVHIANYFIDFKVWLSNGVVEYHEVKGFETDIWRMKWRLCKALYKDLKFVLIK